VEGGVGLADNKYFQANVSEEIRAEIKALEEKVTAGEIEVISAYGKTTEEITAIRDAVKP
ncbi:MAG: BMP family lipoprotein, partial [Erysipelotrichaceae bacterium]